jgi:G3E family GTPase
MANPGPIASLFWLDDALDSRLRLDGIVTLVDAANIERQLSETEEAAQQIAYADRILLNKVDLVKSTDPLLATIRSIHPTVAIRSTTYAAVPDLDWILEARCFDADRAKEMEETLSETQEPSHDHSHEHEHEHEHDHDHDKEECALCKPVQHRHTSEVSTVALTADGPVDWRKVNVWLASILWPNQDEQEKVLRRWTKEEVRSSKLVVIGRYLQEESLRAGFNACLANK